MIEINRDIATVDCEIWYVERRGRIILISALLDKEIVGRAMIIFHANQRKFGHIYPELVGKWCAISYFRTKNRLWVAGIEKKNEQTG